MIRCATLWLLCFAFVGCSTDDTPATQSSVQSQPADTPMTTDRPSTGTVESLLELVAAVPDLSTDGAPTDFTLWVPETLTLNGDAVPQDAAMAVVLDKLLGLDFFPDGFEQGDGGRLYKYQR